MKKLLCAMVGALVISAASAPAQAAPVAPAVFHPDAAGAATQLVQYQSHYRPRPHRYYRHRPYRHRYHPHPRPYRHGPPPPPVYQRY